VNIRKLQARLLPGTTLPRAALLLALIIPGYLLWSMRHLPALGTDSLIYHLTIPATWLQEGFLSPVDLPFHDSAAEHSPLLSQVLNYLLMALTGDDGLAWLVQPAALLLTAWLFFTSARLMGLSRAAAMPLAGLLLFFLPFLHSMQVVNNEMILTAGFALFACGLLLVRARPGRGTIFAAAGIALMLATKVVGVIYAAVALPLLAVTLWTRWRRTPAGRRRRLAWLGAAALALLLAGSFFYLRNWIAHGSPLHPAHIRIGGWTLFDGLYDASSLVSHGWSPKALWGMLVHDGARFAPKWFYGIPLWLGFAVCLATSLLRGRRRLGWARAAVGVAFPAAAVLLFFAFVPFWNQHRLLFPVYYALWLGLAGALGRAARLRPPLSGRVVKWALTVLALGLTGFLLWATGALGPAAVWAVLLLVPVAAWAGERARRRRARRPHLRLLIPAAAVLLAAVSVPFWYGGYRLRRERVRGRLYANLDIYREGLAWNMIGKLGRREGGLTVAYSGTPLVFPLFGPRLENRATYVPVSAADRPRPVEPEPGKGLERLLAEARRARPDAEFWLAELDRRKVGLLFLVDRPQTGGTAFELEVVRQNPDRFERLHSERAIHLFRVKPAPGRSRR